MKFLFSLLLLTVFLSGCRTPTTFPRNQTIPSYISPYVMLTSEEKAAMEAKVTRQILEVEKETGANIGFAFRDLNDPSFVLVHNGDKLIHAASTMKIAVMIETFRQSETGRFSMSDLVTVNDECVSVIDGSAYKVKGADFLQSKIGEQVTILKLVEEMMVISDNLATNMLIQLTGPENITNTMRELGAPDGAVLRGLEDIPAFEAGYSNRFSPRDLMELLTAIHEGRAGNRQSTNEMVRILLDQHYTDMIPKYLPKSVAVGHKTGFITGHRHDAAIVYGPKGPYVLVLMGENMKDTDKSKDDIAKISKTVFELTQK